MSSVIIPFPMKPNGGWSFKHIAYLQSDGAQYIDTGVTPYALSAFEIECSCEQGLAQSGKWFGVCTDSRVNYSKEAISFYIGSSGYLNMGTAETNCGGAASMAGIRFRFYWDIPGRKGYAYRNGSTTASNTVSQAGDLANFTMYLFRANGNTNPQPSDIGLRIYGCRQTGLDGKPVHAFIPVLDPSGRPCMYDTVTKKPFYNKGTGEFKYA